MIHKLYYIILCELNIIIASSGMTKLQNITVGDDTIYNNDLQLNQYKSIYGEDHVKTVAYKNLWMEYQNDSILIKWKNGNDLFVETLVYNGKYIAKYKITESL